MWNKTQLISKNGLHYILLKQSLYDKMYNKQKRGLRCQSNVFDSSRPDYFIPKIGYIIVGDLLQFYVRVLLN